MKIVNRFAFPAVLVPGRYLHMPLSWKSVWNNFALAYSVAKPEDKAKPLEKGK